MNSIDSWSDRDKFLALSFLPLQEQDFALLLDWLNQPHVRAFYQPKRVEQNGITSKYQPRPNPDSPIHCYIINFENIAVGYIQTYLISIDTDLSELIGTLEGATIDLYIGNPAFINRGLGWLIELKFLQKILFAKFATPKCYIYHDAKNLAALGALSKAGFRHVKDVNKDRILEIAKVEVEQKINGLLNRT